MLGRVDNNCEIDTIAGPVPGLVQKPEYCLDHNYEVVLTNGGCGTGFVGVSGECQITFNPHCCVGLDEDLCPIYKGVLTVDKVVAGEYEGVDANKINACPTTDNIDINVALVGPEDLDNMNSILYGCGHAISYNPGTGVMKVSEIDAETCDLTLGGGTAIVCCDCRLHTCLAGTISCDTVYEPLACCTGVSSGETLNATALNCDGKLIKMSCVEYEESPSGYDLPLYSKVIPDTSLTTNTAIKTPFIYNDELSVSAKCNITLGICPTCDIQNNWVTGSYVSLNQSGHFHCLDLYGDYITNLKSGCKIRIQAGSDKKGYCPVRVGGTSRIEMASHDLCECFVTIVSRAENISIEGSNSYSNESKQWYVCSCCAMSCINSTCFKLNCGYTYANRSYTVSSGGPVTLNSECKVWFRAPAVQITNGTFTIGNSPDNHCATITSTGLGTFNGLCVYGNCDVNISDVNINVCCQGELTAKITKTGKICGSSLQLTEGYDNADWTDVSYVPNAHQIDKHIKTNGINDVVVICGSCTYDSPLVDGHVYYLCFATPMISSGSSSPMSITYNWGTNCSKTYNLQYVNENGMYATYTGFDKCEGSRYYVDALAGFFVTPNGNSLNVTGLAVAGKDSTGTREYWIGRGWQSSVSAVQEAFNKARPIGSTYTQFPETADPNTLFNDDDISSVWTELDLHGAFFRASGGEALGFNCGQQSESIGPHCHCVSNLNLNHSHDVGSYRVWGEDALSWDWGAFQVHVLSNGYRAGGFELRYQSNSCVYNPADRVFIPENTGVGLCLNAYNNHGFEGRSGEALSSVSFTTNSEIYPRQPAPSTYPMNYTVRIWKRTA